MGWSWYIYGSCPFSRGEEERREEPDDSEKNEVDQRNPVTPVGLTKNEKGFGNFRSLPDPFLTLGAA